MEEQQCKKTRDRQTDRPDRQTDRDRDKETDRDREMRQRESETPVLERAGCGRCVRVRVVVVGRGGHY